MIERCTLSAIGMLVVLLLSSPLAVNAETEAAADDAGRQLVAGFVNDVATLTAAFEQRCLMRTVRSSKNPAVGLILNDLAGFAGTIANPMSNGWWLTA